MWVHYINMKQDDLALKRYVHAKHCEGALVRLIRARYIRTKTHFLSDPLLFH